LYAFIILVISLSYSTVVYLALMYSSFLLMLTCVLYLVLTVYMYFCCYSVLSSVAACHCNYWLSFDCCGLSA